MEDQCAASFLQPRVGGHRGRVRQQSSFSSNRQEARKVRSDTPVSSSSVLAHAGHQFFLRERPGKACCIRNVVRAEHDGDSGGEPGAADVALEVLDFSGSLVSDMRPIASLKMLRSLDCRGTGVSDLSPLASLPWLKTLFIEPGIASFPKTRENLGEEACLSIV